MPTWGLLALCGVGALASTPSQHLDSQGMACS